MESFFRLSTHNSTLQGHRASGTSPGKGQLAVRFPRNETPKEPVRSGYKYPDARNKYILETLYFGETVNNPARFFEKRTAIAVL
jgi:hypothetical protein